MSTTNGFGTCVERVRRGGPSSGGGYDAMNRTRYEPCGRPAVEGKIRCARHQAAWDAETARLRALADLREKAAAS